VFLLITFLVALAAWNTGASLLYLVMGGLLSFLALSAALVGVSLRGLRVTLEAPEAVHRGEAFGMSARIENHKRVFPSLSLRIERASSFSEPAGYVVQIPPQRAAVLRFTAVYDKRGVYPLPAIAVSCVFPFGLMVKRRQVAQKGEIVVYPRVRSVRAGVIEQLPGARAVPRTATGDGDDFFCLRDYIRGDDPRRIAWRASARSGRLLVKELTQETPRYVVFVLDTYRPEDVPGFDACFEEAVELAASLAVTLLSQQYTVALATATGCLAEGKGKAQVLKVLDLLARVAPSEQPHNASVEAFSMARSTEARLVFISPDPQCWGGRSPFGNTWVLDPREVVCA
jgi:uncharacterized protein (DUF58 family)